MAYNTREKYMEAVVNHFGGREALRAYMDANGVDASQRNPGQAGEILGDYRPTGGIIILGYEDGHYWDTDTSTKMNGPSKWAAIPKLD
jgi:hypothetical protein